MLTIVGPGFRGDGWQWTWPGKTLRENASFLSFSAYSEPDAALLRNTVPLVAGRREGCLACHLQMTGFVAPHEPGTIGCASCHLGNPWTLDKTLAHAGMTLTPGNLSVVNQTCGSSNCHGDIAHRIRHSLMNTMSGVVAVDKYVFGEADDLDAHYDVALLKHSPADSHLRELCASCHLGQDKLQPARSIRPIVAGGARPAMGSVARFSSTPSRHTERTTSLRHLLHSAGDRATSLSGSRSATTLDRRSEPISRTRSVWS